MNLPNKITIVRIALIPLMVIAFYIDFIYSGLVAALIFTVAAFTDFLDGHIARKHDLVTNTGKFLDPIADKVLVLVALCLVLESGLIAPVYGAIAVSIIIARELIISAFRQIAAANGVVISADKAGKIKAVFQDIAAGMFLAMPTFEKIMDGGLFNNYKILSYIMLAVAVVLTIVSGIMYIVNNCNVLKGGENEA